MRDHDTNAIGDDPIMTGNITRTHFNEFPDYCDRLEKLKAVKKN